MKPKIFFEDLDALYEMANAKPDYTGLPFNIWVPETYDNPGHSPRRVKVELKPKQRYPFLIDTLTFAVPVSIAASDLRMLKKFVNVNKPLILASMFDYLDSRDVHDSFAKPGQKLRYDFLTLVFSKLGFGESRVLSNKWMVIKTKRAQALKVLQKLEIEDVEIIPV